MHLESTRRVPGSARPSSTIIAALSELAAEVQKSRTVAAVLATAGQGILRLGMRLYAFEVMENDLVLQYLATARSRLQAMELTIGRPLRGLRAPLQEIPLASEVVRGGRIIHREDLDVLHSFIRRSTGFDPATLDARPETAGINNGVLAPLFVDERTWGLLGVVSPTLTHEDAAAIALFATHVGSALEVALTIETLERTNRELATCNADLARAQRVLVERERLAALGERAAAVAHEVRDPLCILLHSIAGLHGFVGTGAPPTQFEDAQAFARMATEEASHLNRLVSDLLELARPHPPDLRIGSIVPVLESAAAATRLDGRVCTEIASDLPLVQVDGQLMQRALVSLLLNALQATPRDGTVHLLATTEWWEGADAVRIDIVDDGRGIPAEVRARIFEPFFGTDASGTGLWLAIVKRVIESHGGHFSVVSGASGTIAMVRLTAAQA